MVDHLKIKVKGLSPRVDVFTKKLHHKMTMLWNDATKQFLLAILADDKIKVDTGMSKAQLIPLARRVQMVTQVQINPKRENVMSYMGTNSIYRSAPQGVRLGEKAFNLTYGTEKWPVFNFEFKILVWQYQFYEPSWNTIETGMTAFMWYIKDNALKYVPTLSEWIFPTTRIK